MEHKKLFKCQYMYQVATLCLNFVAMETFDVIKDSTSVFDAGLGC